LAKLDKVGFMRLRPAGLICIVSIIGSLAQVSAARGQARFFVDDDSVAAARGNRLILENMLSAAAGKVIKLPAGTIHLDRALRLTPEHSGVTIEGSAPGTHLRNSLDTTSFWTSPSIVAIGTGFGYADLLDGKPNGVEVTLQNGDALKNYEAGTVVYAFRWDGYTEKGVGQLATRRVVVRRSGFRSVNLDEPIDPRCNRLKWLDAVRIRGPAEGDRTATLEDRNDLDSLPIGTMVQVTDGPTLANEARGEFRKIIARESDPPRVTFDRPLRTTFAAGAALVRVKSVRDVTLRDLTIDVPRNPKSVAAVFKYCTGWQLERMRFNSYLNVAGSAQFQFKNCECAEQFDLNTCHDFAIKGGHYRGFYMEEGCFDVALSDCRIGPSAVNGVCTVVGCERLRLSRVQIKGSNDMPITISGRECVVEAVTVEGTKNPANACYLQGERLRVTDLKSDILVNFRGGLQQTVKGIHAPRVMLGDDTDDSPSGGVASDIQSPWIRVKSKAWTVDPPVAAPKPPR
jgi:hypothetical protein